jgi:hypothetical protein
MTVAALYVDARGPYPRMPGVDAWDESRDARRYTGPHPVVAHPPCGPWGRLAAYCRHQDRTLAILAINQVRTWRGVLEHPAGSRLFREFGLPLPGELPDPCGGWTLSVNQCDYGHVAQKHTWLYVVGLPPTAVRIRSGWGVPTHRIAIDRRRPNVSGLKECSAVQRRRTPHAFAEFLVDIARRAALAAATPIP